MPKNSLNTSNATLGTENDRKCYSQWWHVLFLRSWLDKVCIFFKYLSAKSCDSLFSWPCVNLGRLSHQKTINKNNFCLLDLTVDTFFRDSILPLVYFIRSPYDCIQSLIKTYELKVTFIYFLAKKTSKISKIYKIESLTFLRFKFLPLLSQSTSYSHALCHTVQRHIVLRRAQSVGMPRHALRRRMPNTAGLRPRSPARWAGVIPLQKIRPAGWVLPDVK